MPELKIRDVRLPELRLPEMTREDITRALGDARKDVNLDRVDLSRLDPRKVDLSDVKLPRAAMPTIDLSKVDLPKVEVPKAIVDAAVTAGLVKRRRSRWPFVIGALFGLALLGAALSQLPIVRERMAQLRQRRAAEGMYGAGAPLDSGPRAFDAAVAVPIEPAAYSGSAPDLGSPYEGSAPLPDGFGADVADERPMTEDEAAPRS